MCMYHIPSTVFHELSIVFPPYLAIFFPTVPKSGLSAEQILDIGHRRRREPSMKHMENGGIYP